MSDWQTIQPYGDRRDTHHKCQACGEWAPKWQSLCMCSPEYGREAIRKLREWSEGR